MIDLNPAYLETVQRILTEHAPECEVRAYGSRVTWTATDYSDLDLAVVGSEPFSLRRMRQLKEAFEESDLPIRVDVLDWHVLSDGFKHVIAEEYEVIHQAKTAGEYTDSRNTQDRGAKINELLLKSLPLGATPTGWEVVRLADVTSFISTGATPRGGKNVYKSEGVSLIRSQNVYDHEFSRDGLARIDESAAYKLRRVDVQEDDVLLNITGDSVARCCVVPKWTLPARVNQHVAVIRTSDRLNSTFLQKYLSAPRVKAYVLGHDSGGTRKALTKAHIESFLVPLPPLPEQHRIAHILGSLDDKIELNRQMNETLEAMARAIFKSWFVDFDPVRAKMEGREPVGMDAEIAAQFPSSFQDSPLGKIPEGWDVRKFADLADVILGGDWGKETENDNYSHPTLCIRGADIPSLQTGGLGDMPTRYLKSSSLAKRQLRSGDLVIEISGGSPTQSTGRSMLIKKGLLDRLNCPLVYSNFCRLIRLKSENMSNFVYLWFRWLYSNDEFFQYENGTTGIKNLAFTVFAQENNLLVPPMPIVDVFNRKIEPLFTMLQLNGEQSRTLSQIRDTLLPKLLSGEVRVPHKEVALG